MHLPQLRRPALAAALATALFAVPALAQTSTTPSGSTIGSAGSRASDGMSVLPYTTGGYIGLNLGQTEYRLDCGTAGFGCDNRQVGGKLYTGGMFNPNIGAEVGYLHMGRADRHGGRTDAQGLNLSLVGRVPLGTAFSLFAKAGATWGRTRVSADPAAGVATGRRSGWGGSYGVGAGIDITPKSTIVVEWERHDFKFQGSGRDGVDMASIGFVQRF